MSKNWAIAIGINQYNPHHYTPLRYAKRDAELMRDFFKNEARFDEVCYFADDSPPLALQTGLEIPTLPTRGHLRSFLQDRFEQPFLKTGDNCWFFFAGHGERYEGRDYLMPSDASPRDVAESGILVSYVRERLSRCGADNVILILDACRSEGARSQGGIGSEVQQGVITISACSPTQKSWEIEDLGQGVFTYALLEALRLPGERSCATVERLDNHLRRRVPELCRKYQKNPEQLPRISADPSEKHHFILLPQYARDVDIATLQNDAYKAEALRDLDLANRLWIRVLAASMGRSGEAIEALQRIAVARYNAPPPVPTSEALRRIAAVARYNAPPPVPTSILAATDNMSSRQGGEIRDRHQSFSIALSKKELFGSKSVDLEMVAIPGGKFWMGSPDGVGYDDERPRHEVTIAPFFMGKYPVTQAQYEAVMGKDPSRFMGENRPIERVSWHDAIAFCQELSKRSDRQFGLPSEAQWEYACRAGTETKSYFGEKISAEQVNCYNSNGTSDIGKFPSNKFGLYDMHGNVWEWCADHWHENYKDAPIDGSVWLTDDKNSRRLLRGGSWNALPDHCRSACRDRRSPNGQAYYVGFRVVCV
jgi:formylglycine-generating enzyme required for sulfatase activity/uncharacterized caspase-like protein